MVFQWYALCPHLTAADNIGYGLRLRRRGGAEHRQRDEHRWPPTELAALAERYPGELSGGQQQRVALAARWCRPE